MATRSITYTSIFTHTYLLPLQYSHKMTQISPPLLPRLLRFSPMGVSFHHPLQALPCICNTKHPLTPLVHISHATTILLAGGPPEPSMKPLQRNFVMHGVMIFLFVCARKKRVYNHETECSFIHTSYQKKKKKIPVRRLIKRKSDVSTRMTSPSSSSQSLSP